MLRELDINFALRDFRVELDVFRKHSLNSISTGISQKSPVVGDIFIAYLFRKMICKITCVSGGYFTAKGLVVIFGAITES